MNDPPTLTLSTAPPSFTATPPQYVEAKEGGSTLLSCSAQGNPKPIISWLREGEELATNAKYTVRTIAAEQRAGLGLRGRSSRLLPFQPLGGLHFSMTNVNNKHKKNDRFVVGFTLNQ